MDKNTDGIPPVKPEMQISIEEILDSRLIPLLKDEWKDKLSLFDAGAWLDGEKIAGVIVFMRSYDIVAHLEGLLKGELIVDAGKEPMPGVGLGEPRIDGDTLFVRLMDMARPKLPSLFINLFQVFGEDSEEEVSNIYDLCNEVYIRDKARIEKLSDSESIDEKVNAPLEETEELTGMS